MKNYYRKPTINVSELDEFDGIVASGMTNPDLGDIEIYEDSYALYWDL